MKTKPPIKQIISAIKNMDYSNYLLDCWSWNGPESRLCSVMIENMYDSYHYYNNEIYIKNIVFDLSKDKVSCDIEFEFASKNVSSADTEYTISNIFKSNNNKPLCDLLFNALYDNKTFGKNLITESLANKFKIELINQM